MFMDIPAGGEGNHGADPATLLQLQAADRA
jgi:hypothetical protein